MLCVFLFITGCQERSGRQKEAEKADQITLRWMVFGEKSKSSESVISEFNRQLQEHFPDTTVEFEIIPIESYKEKWDMIMAANEPLDIVWMGNDMWSYTEEVKKGSFMALDYLLSTCGKELMEDIPEEMWEKQKRDGKIYGIPLKGALYRKDYAIVASKANMEAYGDQEKIKTINQNKLYSDMECYEVFEEYLENLKAVQKLGAGVSCVTFREIAGKGYEGIYGPDSPFIIKIFDDDLQVYNKYELESYKAYFEKMSEWYQAGYIREDIEEVLAPENENGTKNGYAFFLDESGESGAVLNPVATEYEAIRIPLQNYKYISYESGRNVLAIPRTTEHPQSAVEIINFLNSEAGSGLCKLLCNGFEGRHYVNLDNNRINRVVDEKGKEIYSLSPYAIGNLFLNYETTKGEFAQLKSYNANAYISPLIGFELDTRMIVLEMEKIDLVVAEYITGLEHGTMENWEDTYNEMILKMKEAGVDKVISEMQKQLDVFKESKDTNPK